MRAHAAAAQVCTTIATTAQQPVWQPLPAFGTAAPALTQAFYDSRQHSMALDPARPFAQFVLTPGLALTID